MITRWRTSWLGRERPELLDQALAVAVVRMRLAGHEQLHGPLGVVQDPREPLALVQQQRQSLVGRHPAREAERECVRVEHVVQPREPSRIVAALARLPPQTAPHLVDEAQPRVARAPAKSSSSVSAERRSQPSDRVP